MIENEITLGNWFLGYDGKPFKWTTAEWRMLDESVIMDVQEVIKEPILLTPEIMRNCEFVYQSPGRISGADMWQGMGFWVHKEFTMRGNLSRSKKSSLHLEGYFNTQINYVHELQNFFKILTGKQLEITL